MNKEATAPVICPLCKNSIRNEYDGDGWYNFAWHVDRYHSKPYELTRFRCVCGFATSTLSADGEGVRRFQQHLVDQDDLTEHLLVHDALRVMARIGDS